MWMRAEKSFAQVKCYSFTEVSCGCQQIMSGTTARRKAGSYTGCIRERKEASAWLIILKFQNG